MPSDSKLELVVEVDVNNANAPIKSINTGLSSMEQASSKAAHGASAGMTYSMTKGAAACHLLADVIERVYRAPAPQRWLASFAGRLALYITDPYAHHLVKGRFDTLVGSITQHFANDQRGNVFATGSVAYGFKDVLSSSLAKAGMRLSAVERSPLPGLVRYHSAAPQ